MEVGFEEFAKYVEEQFGYHVSLSQSGTPDTFESLFAEDDGIAGHGIYIHTNAVVRGCVSGEDECFVSDSGITYAA